MAKRGMWPTVRSSDGERGGRGDLIQAVRGNPNSHYNLYATPTATANQLCPSMQKHPGCRAVWGTPTAHPRTHTPRDVHHGEQLANQVGGSLNPTWVEWLMGWPLGWTACDASEMARYRHVWSWPGGR